MRPYNVLIQVLFVINVILVKIVNELFTDDTLKYELDSLHRKIHELSNEMETKRKMELNNEKSN